MPLGIKCQVSSIRNECICAHLLPVTSTAVSKLAGRLLVGLLVAGSFRGGGARLAHEFEMHRAAREVELLDQPRLEVAAVALGELFLAGAQQLDAERGG